MKIHDSPYNYYLDPPGIMGLLDSVIFFWFIILVTLGIFSWLAWKLWTIHSLPKTIAKQRGWRQARLVFWLSILGLIWKPLWIIAVVLVVLDWDALADWIRSVQVRPAASVAEKNPEEERPSNPEILSKNVTEPNDKEPVT